MFCIPAFEIFCIGSRISCYVWFYIYFWFYTVVNISPPIPIFTNSCKIFKYDPLLECGLRGFVHSHSSLMYLQNELLQWALHGYALEQHMESAADTKHSNIGSYEYLSICIYYNFALWTILVATMVPGQFKVLILFYLFLF